MPVEEPEIAVELIGVVAPGLHKEAISVEVGWKRCESLINRHHRTIATVTNNRACFEGLVERLTAGIRNNATSVRSDLDQLGIRAALCVVVEIALNPLGECAASASITTR